MLGTLNKLLVKLCDPRNSVSSLDTSLRASKTAIFGRIAHLTNIRKRPQHEECPERHDTPSNRFHNFQSVINQLPDDLLAEIFASICHADSDQFLGDRYRHKKTTPLVLGSVCSHWRVVVWSNPRIWSHVSLCLSSPSGRYGAQVSLLNEWFQRSGICPLTINIVFQNEEDWTNETAQDLINSLLEQAYRWRSINFVLPEAWYPFLEGIKDNVNQLTTVSTQPLWADCGLSPSKRKRLTLFENAPLLNDLHLNGYYLTDVFLCWSQLTRLTLQHVYLDECFYALPLTPNLTWCRIYTILINDVNRTVVDPGRPILLDKLKKFIVYSAAWGDLMRLLSSISCVELESFEISALFDDLIFPQLSTVLPQLTTDDHHASSLTRLVLSDLDFASRPAFQVEQELKALLQDTPTLEELEIEVSKKVDRVQNSGFCSWWFIDLLGVQEPRAEPAEHGEGKEKGRFEVGLRNSRDELDEGKASSFGPSTRDPSKSSASLREIQSLSPCYILPNLHSFTFSGSVIVHTSISSDSLTSTDNETTDKCSSAFPHSPSFHLPASLRKDKALDFPHALLKVLSTRGGFGSEWLDSLPMIDERVEHLEEEVEALDFSVSEAQEINDTKEETGKPTSEAECMEDLQKIYFLDDEDKILALPADVLPETRSSSPSTSIPTPVKLTASTAIEPSTTNSQGPISQFVIPLPAKSASLNLRKNLETFNLKATTFKFGGTSKGAWHSTNCRSAMRGPLSEVKAGFRRLTEEGEMKMKVVLGGEVWV